jgi:hypothetical protein
MERFTRRNILGAAGAFAGGSVLAGAAGATAALPAAKAALVAEPAMSDIFALGGRQDDDADILQLFRQWCTAWRASGARGLSDEECDAACDIANRLGEQIYDAPVQGVVGLAIKAYMVAQGGGGDGLEYVRGSDPCDLGRFSERSYACRTILGERADVAHLYLGSHALRGLLASAASFVPELRPLVAKAVESPLTLPLDDDAGDVA